MPRGIYQHLPLSEERKKKLSESHKGKIPWNKGTKGLIIVSEDTKIKMSNSHKGKKLSEEHKSKFLSGRISRPAWNKGGTSWANGKHFSEEHKNRISKSNYGKVVSDETRKKMSRPMPEERKLKISESCRGRNNHNWLGGISFEPYTIDWTNSLRISIRERDNYTCQLCGIKQGDKAHSVHHIDYNKRNCDPNNLITLCTSCHSKTNSKRDYWKEYFINLYHHNKHHSAI